MTYAADTAKSSAHNSTIEVHATFGPGGSTRKPEVIAGETLSFLVSVSSISASSGRVDCSLQAELLDRDGSVRTGTPELPLNGEPWLGGKKVVQSLDWSVPANIPPGNHTYRFKVTDRQGIVLAENTIGIRVRPHDAFGAANIRISHDSDGLSPSTGVLAEGAELNLSFLLVGVDVNADRVLVETRVSAVDETGEVASRKPVVSTIDRPLRNDADRIIANNGIPAKFRLGMTRSGKFRVRIDLADKISGKSASYEVPVNVVPRP